MHALKKYPTEIKIFLIASLVSSLGGSLMWPLVSMYVFDELDRSMTDAGTVILIMSLGGIFGQLLGGSLYHRLGVKRLIVGSQALNAVSLLMLPFTTTTWSLFVVMMGFVGFFNAMSFPAIQAFIGFRFADRRGELFNVIYVANNIGVAVGTALSGVLADISYQLSFILNGVTSAVFALFFLVYLSRIDHMEGQVQAGGKRLSHTTDAPAALLLRDVRIYMYVGVGSMFLWLGNSVWNTGVSPFIIEEGLPKSLYGLLWTLNGILIFAAQPLLSWIKRFWADSTSRQLTLSGVFYLSAYIVILCTGHYPGMVAAMVLATLGEMLVAPAIPAFLSDHGGRGAPFYMGLVGGIGAAGRVLGPFMMGGLYDHGGLAPTVWLAAGTAVLCVMFFLLHGWLNRNRAVVDLHAPRTGDIQAGSST